MALIVGLLIFVVGVPSALSFGILSDLKIFGKTVFDLADYAVSNVLMPLGVLLVSIFVPLKMKKDVLMKELGVSKNKGYKVFVLWLFLLRFIAPIAIIIVFLNVLGIIYNRKVAYHTKIRYLFILFLQFVYRYELISLLR